MAKIAVPLFLYAETPLHPGTGAQLGAVDLPVQRERHTGYPIIQGSSLKGVLRALARDEGWGQVENVVFGPDTGEADKHAGAVSFSDARIVLFPVKALGTVFAWTTCPHVLARLRRDLGHAKMNGLPSVPETPDSSGKALVPPSSRLLEQGKTEGRIVLEEFSYDATVETRVEELGKWFADHVLPAGSDHEFWRKKLATDLAVLPSGEFAEFTRSGTEIVTRVKLNEETKTVARGALWTEEHVPSDSLFYALAVVGEPTSVRPPGDSSWVVEQLRRFDGRRIQVGGDETTGRGLGLLRVGGNGHGQAR